MKKYSLLLVFSLLALSFVLSGCGVLINPSSWPGISVYEDTVFVAYEGHVYALQVNNGIERWRFPAEADSSISFYAAPVVTEDGQLLVGSYSGSGNNGNNLYSLDPDRGNENWHFDGASNRYIGSPLASAEGIFAPNADNTLYKLNADGVLFSNWSFQADEPLWSQPVLEGDRLYISSMDHHLYAIGEESGRIQWISEDLGSAVASPPIVGANGNLYVGTFGSQIASINPANGQVLWATDTEDWVWSSPTEADGKLYAGDQSGTFLILDSSSGDELWRMEADGAILGSPLIIDEKVYFASEAGSVYLVEPQGENDWDYEVIKHIEGRLLGPLVAAGDLILIGVVEADSIVVAIDQNGDQEWAFTPDN
jgi:outer membrane protein assembly factor BamB